MVKSVIASEARQPSPTVATGLPRFARNDDQGRDYMRKYPARIDVTPPKEMKTKLRERAKLENISMSEVIRRATRNFGEGLSR